MKKFFTLATIMASSTLLSACWFVSNNDGLPLAPAPITAAYQIQPITSTGFNNNNANDVYSNRAEEAPNDDRYTVQFTADNRIIIEDTTSGGETFIFTEAELPASGLASYMSWMKIFGIEAGKGTWVGGDRATLGILTPAGTNNEYALLRLINQTGTTPTNTSTTDWMLVGTPTTATLTGTATYTGGYYSNIGHNPIQLTANFANSNNAIGVTISRSETEAKNGTTDALGATSISFNADYDSATNTINGTGETISTPGSKFNTADIHGGFFKNGDAVAGLINLNDTTNVIDDIAGGFHATK